MDALVSEAGIADCSGQGRGNDEKCICCRRGMSEKQVDKAVYMHMTTDRSFVPLDSDTPDSQGCFQVGSSCAAKIKRALKSRGLDPALYIGKVD